MLYTEGKILNRVKFISQGDDSGTYSEEKQFWDTADINYSQVNNSGSWYVEAG
jgi:tungstate transport system substrate-binding protein